MNTILQMYDIIFTITIDSVFTNKYLEDYLKTTIKNMALK